MTRTSLKPDAPATPDGEKPPEHISGLHAEVTNRSSRILGLHLRRMSERREVVGGVVGIDPTAMAHALLDGGQDAATADAIIENVLGTYSLPFAVAVNFQINGQDVLVPMVVEEPSVVAAASNAAKMVRAGGGFQAQLDPPLMIAQVQRSGVSEPNLAGLRIAAAERALLAAANAAVPGLVARGGGARSIEVRDLGGGFVVIEVIVDVRDAMGANLVNAIAEALSPRVAELIGGISGINIVSNLSDRRCVTVSARVPSESLRTAGLDGDEVRDRIARASEFAERDPYRAATHNKGIMNGVDPVIIATGNDWRAVEAGAHAFAAREGVYKPLAVWRTAADGMLEGVLKMPIAVGTVGGTLRVHRGARLALEILGVESAQALAGVAACVGLASNLAALRALVTEGIQRGHMSLHARSVARGAGARDEEIDAVAAAIAERCEVTVDAARRVIRTLRATRAERHTSSPPGLDVERAMNDGK